MAEHAASREGRPRRWETVTTPTFDRWFAGLDDERAAQVTAAMRRVSKVGPVLGRPRADSIRGSQVRNLKELRVHGGVRVLFAFDPNRRAVMLLGGDKTGSWNRWYRTAIPAAERLYAEHLRSIGRGNGGPDRGNGHNPPGRDR
ncbi:MAG: type II toxin-antitoxin system RelE/ParE family toxin [Solirubrobacteraceae bacterium]